MRKININGKEIETNLGGNYQIGNGNSTATMELYIKKSGETDEQMVERIAGYGCTRITIKLARTCVRGYYKTYALAK